MKLVRVQVHMFRNILDADVSMQPDVTCLVGKNESGKTAFLHALYRLKPARTNVSFDSPAQYPAWREKRDRSAKKLEEVVPITATFELDADEQKALGERFGSKVLKSSLVSLQRNYAGEARWKLSFDTAAAIKNVLMRSNIKPGLRRTLGQSGTTEDLQQKIVVLKGSENVEEQTAATAIEKELASALQGHSNLTAAAIAEVNARLPRLFYFHQYSQLPYSVDIHEVLKSDEKDLGDAKLTARSLLRLAGADVAYLLNPDYERRKRELENVANALTADVLNYWTQNPSLRVQPDITSKTVSRDDGKHAVLDELKIRIWDDRHFLSLPFNEHSTGFQWFFSFLAAFNEFEHADPPVIILLDEPALGLHARAQSDFLRFIDERLSPQCQVIYTTHSPFMIQPNRLERARVVEDKGRDDGATVSSDIFSTDPDTLFPLQSALGYDLAQHLFVAPHNLVVEGTSDLTYLTILSSHLLELGRVGLDDRWSVVPVGGADLVPTFVALLGHHLDVTVVLDSRREGHQKLKRLVSEGFLAKRRIIPIGDVLNRKLADIEDLFEPQDYLEVYNRAFKKAVAVGDLQGKDPIVVQIARHEGIARFDHGKPADVLLRQRDQLLPKLTAVTLDQFEELFKRINATLQ